MSIDTSTALNYTKEFEEYEDEDEKPRWIPEIEEPVYLTGKFLNQHPVYDHIISSEVRLYIGDVLSTVQVQRRALGPDEAVVV